MRFYPNNDLYSYYKRNVVDTWLSPRVRDHTLKRSLDLINNAINVCERWGTFLDIGAGSGRYSVTLLSKFKKGYAVEIDPNEDLKKAAKKYKNLQIILRPIQQVKLSSKIDFILLADVFEHIPIKDVPKFVNGLAKLQSLGGVIHMLTPNALFCGPVEESGIYYKRHQFGHHKHYIEGEIKKIFATAGYEPVFVRYEESRVRLVLKMPMIVCSFLDKKYLSTPILAFLTSPFVFILDKLFWASSWISLVSELEHEHDDLNSRTMVLVLKKTK